MDRRRRLLLMNNVRAKASGGGTPAPTLISLNTASGSTAGGTVVIATGTNLTGASAVSVGGNPATSVSALDSTHVQFTTPAGSAGAASITVTTPGGTSSPLVGAFTYVAAPTLVSLNRDFFVAAGGAVIVGTGTNLTVVTGVTVGGTAATAVSSTSTTVTFTCPAKTATGYPGTWYDVIVTTPGGSYTLTAALESLPTPSTTFVQSNFESGGYLPFVLDKSAAAAVSIQTNAANSGTHSVLCTATATDTAAQLTYAFADNRPLLEANGVYIRFYIFVPDATVTAASVSGKQIKIALNRFSSTAAFLMDGVGDALGNSWYGTPHNFSSVIDNAILTFTGGAGIPLGTAAGFIEVLLWNKRPAGGPGLARIWLNGKHSADVSSANLGSDTTTDTYTPNIGVAFCDVSSPIQLNVDDVAIGNGAFDPPSAVAPVTPSTKGFVQAKSALSNAVTFTGNVTAGNLIHVCAFEETSTNMTCADSLGNTYVQVGPTVNTPGGNFMRNFVATNVTGGACTVTTTSTFANRTIVTELSGCSTATPYEQGIFTGNGTATAGASGNITTLQATNEVLVGVVAVDGAGSGYADVGDGFTVAASNAQCAVSYQLNVAAGTYSYNPALGSSMGYVCHLMSFQ